MTKRTKKTGARVAMAGPFRIGGRLGPIEYYASWDAATGKEIARITPSEPDIGFNEPSLIAVKKAAADAGYVFA